MTSGNGQRWSPLPVAAGTLRTRVDVASAPVMVGLGPVEVTQSALVRQRSHHYAAVSQSLRMMQAGAQQLTQAGAQWRLPALPVRNCQCARHSLRWRVTCQRQHDPRSRRRASGCQVPVVLLLL